jgi:hypothetical protein
VPGRGYTPEPASVDEMLAMHRALHDGRILNQLAVWAPDPASRKTIVVDNPARLYDL